MKRIPASELFLAYAAGIRTIVSDPDYIQVVLQRHHNTDVAIDEMVMAYITFVHDSSLKLMHDYFETRQKYSDEELKIIREGEGNE